MEALRRAADLRARAAPSNCGKGQPMQVRAGQSRLPRQPCFRRYPDPQQNHRAGGPHDSAGDGGTCAGRPPGCDDCNRDPPMRPPRQKPALGSELADHQRGGPVPAKLNRHSRSPAAPGGPQAGVVFKGPGCARTKVADVVAAGGVGPRARVPRPEDGQPLLGPGRPGGRSVSRRIRRPGPGPAGTMGCLRAA